MKASIDFEATWVLEYHLSKRPVSAWIVPELRAALKEYQEQNNIKSLSAAIEKILTDVLLKK